MFGDSANQMFIVLKEPATQFNNSKLATVSVYVYTTVSLSMWSNLHFEFILWSEEERLRLLNTDFKACITINLIGLPLDSDYFKNKLAKPSHQPLFLN